MRTQPQWRASSILLAASGLIVAALGAYFIALRPPLLAEDLRYMQMTDTEASALLPHLAPWLAQVFRVLGGYALATGLLAVTLAATSFRARNPVAVFGAAVGGAASIGLMVAVNFALDSDFKWALAGVASVWGLSLVSFGLEGRTGSPQRLPKTPDEGNAP